MIYDCKTPQLSCWAFYRLFNSSNTLCLSITGIDETVKIVQSLGGFCKGYKVDISNKDQVYKYADLVREEVGEVSAALISFLNKVTKLRFLVRGVFRQRKTANGISPFGHASSALQKKKSILCARYILCMSRQEPLELFKAVVLHTIGSTLGLTFKTHCDHWYAKRAVSRYAGLAIFTTGANLRSWQIFDGH